MVVIDFPKQQDEFLRTKKGNIKRLTANAMKFLEMRIDMQGVARFNKFENIIVMSQRPPWDYSNEDWEARAWTDVDYTEVLCLMQQNGVEVGSGASREALDWFAYQNQYNPIEDYLYSIDPWDHVPRLDGLMHVYFGADQSKYSQKAGAIMMLSAVARIMTPGCKADISVVLEGNQGEGKSECLRMLFDPWFSDNLGDPKSKDSVEQLRGKWCIEIAELASVSKAEVEHTKAFLSRQIDTYRPAYGRSSVSRPRQNIFVMTTNEETYLKDTTGNRRFWPVKTGECGKLQPWLINRDRDMLFAEALARIQAGEKWWPNDQDEELIIVAKEQQSARVVADPWEEKVIEYAYELENVFISDILSEVLNVDKSRQGQVDQNRVSRILRQNGYRMKTVRYGAINRRTYSKKL